ncbi:SURF1 family protein [Limimaricola hongkongensis]|uniref:SURF1-like protein n=1 Tax=Limimaricola hongkongensis DSM 17492 TaxID=1122180 RepID=A0A017HA30_9RHOB|nr:SURF1 family protein [Limimaricola hongkongensis]EYD71160.1 Cytochrome oxidase biogenesis protein Surf1, facilitates heme A insertion [Limimaricola hongkongensis DSM 17492]
MRRTILPLFMGLLGCAILIGLGVWQVQRLSWKSAILADLDARILAAPVPLSGLGTADPQAQRYLPVIAEGRLTGDEIHVLSAADGPGYRVIGVLDTGGRRVMVDLGFVPLAAKARGRAALDVMVTGNLHWPQEVDDWTPAPDTADNIWYARDVGPMAAALGTKPLLIVARRVTPELGTWPMPLDSDAVPNDHLGYAITWFSLAAVWAVMTGIFLWRGRRAAS